MAPKAEDRFELTSDPSLRTLGRRRTIGPAMRIVASAFTVGLIKAERKARVFVRDRQSGAIVLEHLWENFDFALRDFVTLEEDLQSLDVDAFAEHYSITLDPPGDGD